MSIETFKAAVEALEDALEVLGPDGHPFEWVATQIDLARALHAWGIAAPAGEGWRLLQESVDVLKKARDVCSPQAMPELWAALHDTLGVSLSVMAQRARSEDYYGDAIAAFMAAQEIKVPSGAAWAGWRETQNRLIATLLDAANSARDEATRIAYERQAVEATRVSFLNSVDQLRLSEREKRRSRRERRPPSAPDLGPD